MESYVLIEFCSNTKLPIRIDIEVYTDKKNNIVLSDCTVKVAHIKWDSATITNQIWFADLLKTQLEQGFYDNCCFNYADKSWTVKDCKQICQDMKVQMCSLCHKVKTFKLMPSSSFCGCDNIDRINCWQKCWSCQSIPICPDCIVRCSNCTGVFCDKCFTLHHYIPTFIRETCSKCCQEMNLETSPNVCGFNAYSETNYWVVFESNTFTCMNCVDLQEQELWK